MVVAPDNMNANKHYGNKTLAGDCPKFLSTCYTLILNAA